MAPPLEPFHGTTLSSTRGTKRCHFRGWSHFFLNIIIKEKSAPLSKVALFSKTAPGWSSFGSTFFLSVNVAEGNNLFSFPDFDFFETWNLHNLGRVDSRCCTEILQVCLFENQNDSCKQCGLHYSSQYCFQFLGMINSKQCLYLFIHFNS